VVDDGGDVVLARDYSPFGVVLSESGTGGSGYGFTGEQWDGSFDMLFLRARWYNVRDGRFQSQDPWPGNTQQPSSLHKYLYVANNPLRYTDPSGHCPPGTPCLDVGKGGGEEPFSQYMYTRYGWIDFSHVGVGSPSGLIQSVAAKSAVGGGELTYRSGICGEWNGISLYLQFEATYRVEGELLGDQIVPVALGIFEDFSDRFESWQATFWPLPRLVKSSFAIEDYPSNFVGFYMAATGQVSELDFVFRTLGGGVTPPGSEPPDDFWGCRGSSNLKNDSFQPKVLDDRGNWVHTQWPGAMQRMVDSMITDESGLWSYVSHTQRGLMPDWFNARTVSLAGLASP
jgi:RHS repeat-associated protein